MAAVITIYRGWNEDHDSDLAYCNLCTQRPSIIAARHPAVGMRFCSELSRTVNVVMKVAVLNRTIAVLS